MKKFIKNAVLTAAGLFALAGQVHAADYPVKPIRLIVPFSAGGPTDIMARLVAEQLSKKLGQVITVLNKPGGDNLIAAREVVASAPDGYTLFFTTNGLLSIAPAVYAKYPIDTQKDFSYIGGISSYPYIFVTSVNEKRNTLQEFIAASRKKAESVSYAIVGNVSLVSGALFTTSLGIDMLPVRYKGNADTVSDLYAERLDLGTFAPSFSIPLIEAKKLKPLGVTGEKRLAKLPDVPLVSELDPALKNYSSAVLTWTAIVAPAGLPDDIKKKLEGELKNVVSEEHFIKQVENLGDTVAWKSSKQTEEQVGKEIGIWKKVVKDARLELQ